MQVSTQGRSLIESFEGCRLAAYLCPAGVPTIGYGHTAGVKMGDTLPDKTAADNLLSQDLVGFAGQMDRALAGVPASQHQFDAMVSLAFNIGMGNFSTSTVMRQHKAGQYAAAAAAFALWNKATVDGQLQVLPGLVSRRAAEAALYQTADINAENMPRAVST